MDGSTEGRKEGRKDGRQADRQADGKQTERVSREREGQKGTRRKGD